MIFDLIRGNNVVDILINLVAKAFVVVCILPFHEFAHAFVADKLGDKTARNQGRLTLEPFAHLDPIGALMIFLVGFGYAKPVPVNPRNFKNPKKGMALTALAGPVSNLIMGFICAFLMNGVQCLYASTGFSIARVLFIFFSAAFRVNIGLAVFNLIPVPPLDGSRILNLILPTEIYFKVMKYERYIMIGMFVLLMTNILTIPLNYITGLICRLFNVITALPFSPFFR